ncbi:alveolar macrophage chemotactic factor-like [Protopterus annectens]|uniref:alveolar macrophage chemotactic factor-like n=1 Tax=Protopterus annectens TaxID=7888 RepID=UPI001CF93822|nr:alveolar macrophage chemotactic factor-like [Protopterus annectens]
MTRNLVIIALIAASLVSAQHITFDGTRCLCHRTRSKFNIPPNVIKNVEIFPASASCEHMEIILNLKNGRQICLDPSSQKIRNMIHLLRKKNKETMQ